MALKSHSFLLIVTFLGAFALFGASAALGGRKLIDDGAAPPPADDLIDDGIGGAAPSPAVDFDYGFVAMDRNDPEMIKLGIFAVDQYNKVNKKNVIYEGLLEALYYPKDKVQGKSYSLVVLGKDGTEYNSYSTDVVLADGGVQKLTAFEENQ